MEGHICGANQNQNPTPILLVVHMGQITGCTVEGDLCVMCLNALGCASGFHDIPNCFMNGGKKVRRLSIISAAQFFSNEYE